MRFWTIQPPVVGAQMEQGDSVRVNADHPRYGGQRELADTDSSRNRLMAQASAEWVGIAHELRGADSVSFTHFEALGAPGPT